MRETAIHDRTAWRGEELDSSEWVWWLSDAECRELQEALEQSRTVPTVAMGAADFPLGALAGRIQDLVRELEYGRGFVLLRGLGVGERFTEEEATRIYWGIASHMGRIVSQNRKGDLIGNIRDEAATEAFKRTYASSGPQDFHTDLTDFVGLLCLRPALHGGESILASSAEVYNTVLAERPEYLPLLFEPFATDWMSEEPPGAPGWYWLPLFGYSKGYLSAALRTARALWAMRFPEVRRISADEMSCFMFLEAVPKRAGLALEMLMEPGDIQFVSNYTVLHGRKSFVDDKANPARQRHLLRLWISRDEGRPVCPEYAVWKDGIPAFGSLQPSG